MLWLLYSLIFPTAYAGCLGEIVYRNAKNRGMDGRVWAVFAIGSGILAAYVGFKLAPFIVPLNADPVKVNRLYMLCLWVPGVLVSTCIGALPSLLPKRTPASEFAPKKTFKAGDWYKDATCSACGFLFEKADSLCECDRCSTQFHASCWTEAMGCPKCDALPD